ncbi:MAG TPA: hypothetical protein PKD53_22985 [Chloroflexaceae bacterium]|nr:hypothetical protein [Chloroflexaceae bacterium]
MFRPAMLVALVALLAGALAPHGPPAAAQDTGTIAYVRAGGRQGDQIRLIEPDGSGDRLLWAVPRPDPRDVYAVSSLAWRPDAAELAFGSDHEDGCSVFASDIYGIRPDGRGYRRLVNTPTCAGLAGYPRGSVTVTVRNETSSRDANFSIYVQGAPRHTEVLILPGATVRVTVPDVADLGNLVQLVVVFRGDHRWPVAGVDVVPGQNTLTTPRSATIFGEGIPDYGAWSPSWRGDGSEVSYSQSGSTCVGVRRTAPATTPLGVLGRPLLEDDRERSCWAVWAPPGAPAGQLLYGAFPWPPVDGYTIFRGSEGGRTSAGVRLVAEGVQRRLLSFGWLPDGSGLLFARTTRYENTQFLAANIFHYDFATGQERQVTQLSDSFARSFSVAPDGRTIVFERGETLGGGPSDLWLVGLDGSGLRLLARDGRLPTWSSRTPASSPLSQQVFLPQVLRP